MMDTGPEHEEGASESGGMMRWLITYADLITLLLAFFIILYAMNRTQQVKFSLVSQALAKQFDSKSIVGRSPGPSIMTGASGTQVLSPQELKTLNQLQNRLQAAINKQGLAKKVSVFSNLRGVEVSLKSNILFKPGSATLSSSAGTLLNGLGHVLKTVPNDIEVAGYTDSRPIHTPQFASNWQLSAMRAANVVYVLGKIPGIQPDRLFVMGFGPYHPVASNQTSQGRQDNRRVNILVLRSPVARVAIGSGL